MLELLPVEVRELLSNSRNLALRDHVEEYILYIADLLAMDDLMKAVEETFDEFAEESMTINNEYN